jgi:hypothetical protein
LVTTDEFVAGRPVGTDEFCAARAATLLITACAADVDGGEAELVVAEDGVVDVVGFVVVPAFVVDAGAVVDGVGLAAVVVVVAGVVEVGAVIIGAALVVVAGGVVGGVGAAAAVVVVAGAPVGAGVLVVVVVPAVGVEPVGAVPVVLVEGTADSQSTVMFWPLMTADLVAATVVCGGVALELMTGLNSV